jgi:hypothetical protein
LKIIDSQIEQKKTSNRSVNFDAMKKRDLQPTGDDERNKYIFAQILSSLFILPARRVTFLFSMNVGTPSSTKLAFYGAKVFLK